MFKYLVFGAFVLLALGAGYYLGLGNTAPTPQADATQKIEMVQTPAQKPVFEWIIEMSGLDTGYAPTSTVRLRVNGVLHTIGTYNLSCNEQAVGGMDANQLSRVICWWGGGGHEVGIFEEGGKYVVKQGDVDEGTAETEGFRGNFKTVLEL